MALFSVRGESPLETALRLAAMLLVVAGVALAFWKNGERNMERLSAQAALSGPAGTFSEDERRQIEAHRESLKRRWGLELRVRVADAAPGDAEGGPAETGAKGGAEALFLLEPARGRARVQLPELAARALGPDFARGLESEHFPMYFAPGRRWQQGLLLALDLLEARLAAPQAQPSQPSQQSPPPDGAKDKP